MPVDDDAAWRPPTPPVGAGGGNGSSGGADDLLPGYDSAVELARGGDSVVHRARQRALGRDVAVKVVQVDDAATRARFERELEITVRLGRQHPNIITVIDTGVTEQGHPAIVMDLVERGSLHDVLVATGPLPVADVVRVGAVIADALSFAHSQGVLHRDVKPQNILVLPTSYVLSDFGISRLADSGHTASVERFSYRHAAPQVLDGHAPTAADDIWSLGSTLHTLLDGRAPFASDDPDEDTALAYLRRARTEEPRELRRADVPPALLDVIARCLRKEPSERFATAEELHRALVLVETESRSWAPATVSEPEATPELSPDTAAEPEPEPEVTAPPEQPAQPEQPDRERPLTEDPEPPPAEHGEAPPPEQPEPVPSPQPTETDDAGFAPAAAAATPSPTPPGQPAPTTHQPPARSALAHEARAGAGAAAFTASASDAAPTSLGPTLTGPGPGAAGARGADHTPAAPGEPDPGHAGERGWMRRRVVAGLLLGCGVGVAVTLAMLRDSSAPTTTRTQPSTNSSAVPSATVPSTGVTPRVPVSDPRIAPLLVDVRPQGTSVALEWRDRSEGKAIFLVTQTNVSPPVVLAKYDPGVTKAVVELRDPNAPRVCIVVGAITGDRNGTSDERCFDPRS